METRSEHLAWCKKRALKYLDNGDLNNAFLSFISDIPKHDQTKNHPALMLGMALSMGGQLTTDKAMREFIEGTN